MHVPTELPKSPQRRTEANSKLRMVRSAPSTTPTALLERICIAFAKAREHASGQPETYAATLWWQRVRSRSLSPVQTALTNFDLPALERMYQGFYRDPCAQGLVDWPRSWNRAGTRGQIEEAELRVLHNETRYRLGCWRAHTGGRYPMSALESPDIGKPFGVWIDGTFVVTRAEYHHACACRTAELTSANGRAVELGGGYGGMAYHLIRATTAIQYINFDVPETLALAAYYLANAFPDRKLVLCGEEGETLEDIPGSAIVLLPPWRMPWLSDKSVDVSFSSHLLCDLHPAAQVRYLTEIARFTRGFLVHCGRADDAFAEVLERHFHVIERRHMAWHLYRDPAAMECEQLLRPIN